MDKLLGHPVYNIRIVDSLAIRPVLHLTLIQFPVPNVDIGEVADQRPHDDVKVFADYARDAVSKVGLLQGHPVQCDVESALCSLEIRFTKMSQSTPIL